MNPNLKSKFHLLKHTVALWTLLGVTISMLLMFLLAGPGDMCATELAPINNNYFGEYWLEIILFMNAILYGVGMWIWQIRIYLKSRTQKQKKEFPRFAGKKELENEEWGV